MLHWVMAIKLGDFRNLSFRLTVDRLENEKKELLYELQLLRKQINPDAGGPSDIVSSNFYR